MNSARDLSIHVIVKIVGFLLTRRRSWPDLERPLRGLNLEIRLCSPVARFMSIEDRVFPKTHRAVSM
jgi:hypothetical protein